MFSTEAGRGVLAGTGARWWALVPAVLLACIFLLDISQPPNVVFSMLYVVPIVLTVGMGGARATYIAFLVSSVATVAAAAFGVVPFDPVAAFTNRSLALLAQVLAAAVVIQQINLRERDAARPVSGALAPAVGDPAIAGLTTDIQALVASLPEALAVLDTRGIIVQINAAALTLLGLERAQVEGRPWSAIVPILSPRGPRAGPLEVGAAAAAWPASGPETFELEAVVQPAGGDAPVHVALIAALLRDTAGALQGGVVVGRDVTSARVREAGKDAFIAMAAHELRAPLSTLRGYAQLARANARSAGLPAISATMDKTLRQVDHLNGLIGDLLDVSRMHLGRIDIQRAAIGNVEAFVHDVVEQHRAAAPTRTIEIVAAAALPALCADPRRLQQVLVNLLDNAIKYSPDDSPIRVVLAGAGDELQMSVHDQGIGIPAAEQEHIFQRFYRGAGAPHRSSGLGVGLFIANQIVEAHGGTMWVRSAEGAGSAIGFTLPIAYN